MCNGRLKGWLSARHSPPAFVTAGFRPVRSGLLLVAMVSTLGMPYQVLMPVMASDVFGGGANTLGLLMTSAGIGALTGTLYLASRRTIVGLGRRIAQATMAFGAALVAFAWSSDLWLSLLFCRCLAPAA